MRPLVNVLVCGATLSESDLLEVLLHSGDMASPEEFYKVKNYVGKKAKTITNASYQMQLVVTNVADPEPNKYGNSDPDPSVGFYQKLSKVKERHKYWCRKTFYLFFQSSVNFCFSFIKVLP